MTFTKVSALRSKMALDGLKDKDLAELLSLSKSAISRRMSGEVAFRVEEVAVIQNRLRLSNKEVHQIFLCTEVA